MNSSRTLFPMGTFSTTSSNLPPELLSLCHLASNFWGVCTHNIQHHTFDFQLQVCLMLLLHLDTPHTLYLRDYTYSFSLSVNTISKPSGLASLQAQYVCLPSLHHIHQLFLFTSKLLPFLPSCCLQTCLPFLLLLCHGSTVALFPLSTLMINSTGGSSC